ncbi:MAG TPA: NAD(P)-dependent oxidoreductase, partial [Sphingobium sp.]|nr:NAD(P)-dependent oxidoreductase [Sphingobium sp.]
MSPTRSIPVLAYGPLSPYLREQLDQRFIVHAVAADADPASLSDAEREARALVSFGVVGASAAIMDALPKLELIGLFSVGYDKVDIDHARASGIRVSNTPDVLTDDVADLAVGLLYATVRNIAANDRMVRSGAWAEGRKPALSGSVTGRRIGILGLGRIGRAIARRLEPVAGEILYHNRRPAEGAPYRYVSDPIRFAGESDVIMVATSGGPEARGLVDAAMLEALGPQGVIVNISRGSVID